MSRLGELVDLNRWAAPFVRGGKLVVMCGDRRDEALQRLAVAFGLAEVIHCPTRQSDPSASRFEATLRQPDISLVLWLSGLTRTSHGRLIRDLCRRLQLPWLTARKIPHPNALRAQLQRAASASTRLGSAHLVNGGER